MTLDEVKRFRQLDSKTPGHPELTHAPSGVETTTGPLGQGVANAVGMAVAAKMAEARFNTKEHTIFDHHVVCLAGDGCMQEGVAMEAVEFAGHQKLDNLILIYDSNAVTLDAMANETQSLDAAKRSRRIGFDVQTDRRSRHGRRSSRRSSARSWRAAASRSSSSRRRSSARASPRSRARRRRTAKAARSSPTPRARTSACRPSTSTSRPRCSAFFAEHEQGARRRLRRVDEDLRGLASREPEARRASSRSRAPTRTPSPRTRRRARPTSQRCSRRSPSSRPTRRSRRARPGRTCSSRSPPRSPLLIGGSADLYGSTLNYIGDLRPATTTSSPGTARAATSASASASTACARS